MGMKRSLEIMVPHSRNHQAREDVVRALEQANIEVANYGMNFVQVRKTTPTEVRRLCKGLQIKSIKDGFRL